jgi:hypothetical protein
MAIAAKIPIIATTIINSMSVNPLIALDVSFFMCCRLLPDEPGMTKTTRWDGALSIISLSPPAVGIKPDGV